MTTISSPATYSHVKDPVRIQPRAWMNGHRPLVLCGVVSSVLYIAMNALIPLQWDSYSVTSHTISELSAIDAPTRTLWVRWAVVYSLFLTAFGWGVYKTAGSHRSLRVVGVVLMLDGLLGLAWPPMHQRAVLAAGGGTLTDTLHIVWTFATVLLMTLTIGFGAVALGPRFRLYSVTTLIVLVVFGVLTGLDAPKLEANLPTPWVGVWERISVAADMLWVAVLAVTLLRRSAEDVGVASAPMGSSCSTWR